MSTLYMYIRGINLNLNCRISLLTEKNDQSRMWYFALIHVTRRL